MNIDELREQLLNGTYYNYGYGWVVKLDIAEILIGVLGTSDFMSVRLVGGGYVDILSENIKPVRRPGNIIAKFKWCYLLKNKDGECIGYIGEKEE